jgi:divalent metal cation (Fe/Co/Zn/Cd) transporter
MTDLATQTQRALLPLYILVFVGLQQLLERLWHKYVPPSPADDYTLVYATIAAMVVTLILAYVRERRRARAGAGKAT